MKLRRAIEKMLIPAANVSYSQAGEDMVLDFLCDYRSSGFYVDVGCNHPIQISNTYRFYRKGWSGIAVDANPKFEKLFREIRPRDRFVLACVSDREEDVIFHFFASDALSSISGAPLYDNPQHYTLQSTETQRTRTITDILDEAGAPQEFDILNIDVEGHDEAALRSVNLVKYRPRVIVIELDGTELNIGRVADHPVAKRLGEHGFEPACHVCRTSRIKAGSRP
jgi:FkbM family methyltransferase